MILRLFSIASLPLSWSATFRIGTGLILLLSGLQLWRDLPVLYGAEAIVDNRLLDLYATGPTGILGLSAIGQGVLATYLLLCLALTAGIHTRYVALALCVLHHDIFIANAGFSYGFDFIAASAIFYCIWLPHRKSPDELATPVRRVMQVHLCLIYLFGGLEKLIGPTWHDGESVWKALHQPELMGALRPDISFLGNIPAVVTGLGWTIIALELAYPVAIWYSRLRSLWLWGIIGMHIGIAVFLGLYHFSALMIVWNLAAFRLPYRDALHITEQIAAPHHHPASRPSRPDNPGASGPAGAPSLDPS